MKKGGSLKRNILIIGGAIIVAFIAGSYIVINHFMKEYFDRTEQKKYSEYMRWADYEDFPRETVSFPSGNEMLTGYIYGKDNTSQGLVVISHGLSNYSEKYIGETKYFVDHGFMVFAFDNTGSGESTGDSCIGLAQSAVDLDNALSYIEGNPLFDGLPICLYGHSWGGYATTAVLNYDHDIAAVASLAGYNDCMEEMTYVGKSLVGPFIYAEYPFIWLTMRLTFGDKMDYTAADGINRATDTAVMIIQGDQDDFVGYDGPCIYTNRDKITNPKTEYVLLEGKRHNDLMMDYSEERQSYVNEISAEYSRLLEQYHGEIPDEVAKAWSEGIDKTLTSRLDEELIAEITEFYLKAIGD